MGTYIVRGRKTQGTGKNASCTLTEHTIKASSEAEAIRLVRWEVEQSHVFSIQSSIRNQFKQLGKHSHSAFSGGSYWEWQPESVQLKR